jgi:NAD-dependent SIR2 family protein deacetylase
MQQRKMIDIPLGTEVRTALRAPIDGDYQFVQHITASKCKPSAKESRVYKFRGELLPPCPKCGKRAVWKLVEYKFEIPPDRNKTAYILKVVRGDRPDVAYPSGTKKK